jgi:hypothetical protein
MFFKRGLRGLSLIYKITMKNLRSLEETLVIANKYAMAEEATLDNKEAKKDKKSSQSDRLDTSKGNDKKRKHDRFVVNMEWSQCNRTEYWPRPG